MIASIALGLLGLAAASPMTETLGYRRYPPVLRSKGFRLVVNVTDGSRDFHPPVHNTYLASIHVGAGLALVGHVPTTDYARIFYQNGTAEERRDGRSTVVTDGGTPAFPSGLRLTKDEGSQTVSTARLDFGLGTPGVRIASFPQPYAFVEPETWAACNESIAYYQGAYFVILKQADTTVGPDGAISRNVPDGCAPVRLVPECTALNDLPKGSYSSHEYAIEDRCYQNVSAIQWSEYNHWHGRHGRHG